MSAQFHAEPQVRVTAVSDYFDKRCNMLERAKFLPIIVFDGQRNPLKEEESDARQRIDLDHEYTALHEMYLLPGEYSLDEVLMRRKITIYPREDIFEEVIRAMREKGRRVVGSPFESDSQIPYPSYLRRFNIRARRYVAAVAADRAKYDANNAYGCLPPTLYGCWAEHYVDHALAPGEGEEEIADHMDYPDIYSPGVDYEIEESDEEESDEEADSVCS